MKSRPIPASRILPPSTLLNPVPAAMISCKGVQDEATPNIITLAWVGTVNSEPPMLSISVMKKRYSHDLIETSGEFVVNIPDAGLCKATDFCGVKSGRDTDKFSSCDLTPVSIPELTYAPLIAECPLSIACKVDRMLELGSHDMFIGRIVAIYAHETLFDENGSLHLEDAHLLAYNHGCYQELGDVKGFFGYSIARPEKLKKRMSQLRK